MNITKESASPTEVTLNVEMEPEDEEPFINRSYRRLVGRVRIPGFRPGKAPRSILERHLGREALLQEALEFMVPETLDQVLKEENLQAFMEPELEVLGLEPVSFKAVVALEPVVELGDLQSIRLERQPIQVTEDEVSEVIDHLRYESGPWEPVDRPVQFGDLLTLNVTGIIAGEEAINDQNIDFIPQQDNPLPIPGFSVYLEGMSEGQEKDFTLAIPEDHHQDQYAAKDCRVHVEVISIKEKKLPDLDDEFAKGVKGGYETLEALRDFVRQQLTETAETNSQRQLEQDSLDELLRIATIQASDLIYQRELDNLYQERHRSVTNQRVDMDTYLSYIGTTEEEWREQLRPQAERRLNTYLVIRQLAADEQIDVEANEIQAEIDSMTEKAGDSEESMRRVLNSDSARETVRTSLLNRKVLQRVAQTVEGNAEGSSEETASNDNGSAEDASDSDTPPVDPDTPDTRDTSAEEDAEKDTEEDTAAASPLDPEGNKEGANPNAE